MNTESINTWAFETMRIINSLTPGIKGKVFDPDWFLLRQRLEAIEKERDAALALSNINTEAELLKRTQERDQARAGCAAHHDAWHALKESIHAGMNTGHEEWAPIFIDAIEKFEPDNGVQSIGQPLLDRLTALEAEVKRLEAFHVEDMRVTNDSADFHIKECQRLRDAVAACESRWAACSEEAAQKIAALEKQANAAMDKIMTLDAELRQWRRMKTDPGCTHMNLMTGAIALTRKQALHFADVEEQMKKDCAP